jgi:hypothetical protein
LKGAPKGALVICFGIAMYFLKPGAIYAYPFGIYIYDPDRGKMNIDCLNIKYC